MKTNKILAFCHTCILLATAFALHAQVDLTTNPVNLIFGNLNAGADMKVQENFSLEANVAYSKGNYWGLVDKRETVPVNLIAKYYFNPKNGADGFYADGFARFVNRRVTATYKGDNENIPDELNYTRNQVGLGVGLGYKVVSQKGFVFDIGTGIGRAVYHKDKINVSEQDYKIPSLIKAMGYFKIGLGYRFGGGRE